MDCLATTLKERILSQKCSFHPKMNLEMLNIDLKTEQHLVCSFCVQEQGIQKKQLIPINSILSLDPLTKLPIFPLEEDFLQLLDSDFDLDAISTEVESYFNELKDKIMKVLDRKFDFENSSIQEMILSCKKAKMSLGNSLSINEIQELLLSEDLNDLNKVNEFIKNKIFEFEQKIVQIKEQFMKIDIFQSNFSTSECLIPNEILSLLEKINLFNGRTRNEKFEFLHPFKKWEEDMLKCEPSTEIKNNVKDLSIHQTHDLKNIEIVNISNDPYFYKQCYLSPQLQPDVKYAIKLKFNNQSDDFPHFSFGLIQSKDKNQEIIWNSSDIFKRESDGGRTTSILRGSCLHQGWEEKKIGEKYFEFRVHIQKKLWRASQFPEYINVVQLDDKNSINPDISYHFSIGIGQPNDSVTIIEVLEVSEFNNKM